MAFMGGLAGLGAAPGGFVDMTRKLTEEDQRQQELLLGEDRHALNQQALTRGQFGLAGSSDDVLGTEALGRALAAAGMSPAALTGGVGPGMPDGAMAPPPGAPSTPSIGPSAGTPPGSPIGDRFGTWDQTNTPAGLPATVPQGRQINGSQSPSGEPPLAAGGTPPGPMPPGGGAPGGAPGDGRGFSGGFDLQTVAAKILEANPGLEKNPRVLMAALVKAAPLLNMQAKQELAQARIDLQNSQLDLKAQTAGMTDETRRRGQNPDAVAVSKFLEANPGASPEQIAAYRQTLRAQGSGQPTATQLKLDESARRVDVVDNVITDALGSLKTGYQNGEYLTGVGGKTQRVAEVLANLSGWSDKTAANNFAQKLELLKTMAPQILAGTARTSKDERARVDRIIRGLDYGDTSQITVADLQYLQQVIKQLRPATSGAKTAPSQTGGTTPGGTARGGADDAFRAKAKAEGYTDDQISEFLKNRK